MRKWYILITVIILTVFIALFLGTGTLWSLLPIGLVFYDFIKESLHIRRRRVKSTIQTYGDVYRPIEFFKEEEFRL